MKLIKQNIQLKQNQLKGNIKTNTKTTGGIALCHSALCDCFMADTTSAGGAPSSSSMPRIQLSNI